MVIQNQTLAFISPNIVFKCAQVEEVSPKNVLLVGGETVDFDYCVVCTGATYGDMPWKAAIGEKSWSNRVATFEAWHAKAESAKNIVISGAGFVGVELAAQLGFKYKGTAKKLVLAGTFLKEASDILTRYDEIMSNV